MEKFDSSGFSAETTLISASAVPHRMVSYLVGVVSPVNHYGLYQAWKQTSIHLLVILYESLEVNRNISTAELKYFTQKKFVGRVYGRNIVERVVKTEIDNKKRIKK